MFGLNEKISFSIHAYNEDGNLIYTLNIPKELNYNFKLPQNVAKVEVKEYNGFLSIQTILTIYLGEMTSIEQLLETGKKVILDEKIDESIITKETKLLAITNKDNELEVKKPIEANEIAFNNIEQIENYIRKLSKEISKFEQSTNKVRKFIKITH